MFLPGGIAERGRRPAPLHCTPPPFLLDLTIIQAGAACDTWTAHAHTIVSAIFKASKAVGSSSWLLLLLLCAAMSSAVAVDVAIAINAPIAALPVRLLLPACLLCKLLLLQAACNSLAAKGDVVARLLGCTLNSRGHICIQTLQACPANSGLLTDNRTRLLQRGRHLFVCQQLVDACRASLHRTGRGVGGHACDTAKRTEALGKQRRHVVNAGSARRPTGRVPRWWWC